MIDIIQKFESLDFFVKIIVGFLIAFHLLVFVGWLYYLK